MYSVTMLPFCMCMVLTNGLQVHQVDKENDEPTSTYTKLVPSKFIPACNAHVHYSGCMLTIVVTPTIIVREAKQVPKLEL